MRRRLFASDHPEIASSLMHVAIFQVATQHYQEAGISAHTAAEIYSKTMSPSSWRTAVAEAAGGAALTGIGQYPEAEKQLVRSYTLLSNDAGALPTYRALTRGYLQDLYRRWGRPQQAQRYASATYRPAAGAAPVAR